MSESDRSADEVITDALRSDPSTYSSIFEGFEDAETPPAGKLTVQLTPADEATLRSAALAAGVSEDAYMAHLVYREVFRQELELMQALDDARDVAPGRIVMQVALGEYSADDEVAEHLAGLIDAMSRWQVANGGNPLEIDKLMPMSVTGSAVPRD